MQTSSISDFQSPKDNSQKSAEQVSRVTCSNQPIQAVPSIPLSLCQVTYLASIVSERQFPWALSLWLPFFLDQPHLVSQLSNVGNNDQESFQKLCQGPRWCQPFTEFQERLCDSQSPVHYWCRLSVDSLAVAVIDADAIHSYEELCPGKSDAAAIRANFWGKFDTKSLMGNGRISE